jgi:phosphatidylglycerophosphatase A
VINSFYRLISTCLGIGYIPKGGGTLAAIFCAIAWYFCWTDGKGQWVWELVVTGIVFGLGVWTSGRMENEWGKDNHRIVIDEVAGMCLTLVHVPVTLSFLVSGLVLFRFFDIAKPLFIRRMELLKGGWGVMMDDMLAGLYSSLILQLAVAVLSIEC